MVLSISMVSNPEKLIPHPLGGEPESVKEARKEGAPKDEQARLRREALERAPDLEDLLRAKIEEEGKEVPPHVNLSLRAIEDFRRLAREAQDFRKVVRATQDKKEKTVRE